ncbi:MAG: MFS transporter [Edaphobacter sp.]|uniref:MFS transporter n=1 Tax=Edaphobacter sp. TaxID=1934404 RepID=UPI0023A015B1|nr:MFS transporter [Edaphobacter sp.]MDE1175813.1 MFS transporter [Edaphobacter sp.]
MTERPLLAEESVSSVPLRVLVAACIGNALEFYSVTVYAFAAMTLSPLFFPTGKASLSLLLTFGMFGVSYLARPIGGYVLGAYADQRGRRAALLRTLQISLVGTAIVAFAPTYATLGIGGPLLILVARILQGFAVGGELGNATAYLMEQGPKDRKPLFASLQLASQGLGGVIAATTGLIYADLSPHHRAVWGWRALLAVPLLLAPVGLYIRKHLGESREFLANGPARVSTFHLLMNYRKSILIAGASIAALTANIYFRVYLPAFVGSQLGLPAWSPYVLMYITSFINMLMIPWVASFTTPENCRRIMMVSLVLLTLAVWPAIAMVTTHATVSRLLIGCSALTVFQAAYSAPQCFLIASLFPTQVRGAGVSASYNLAVLAFGGFAPAIFSGLVQYTGNPHSPAFYLLGACVVSFVSLFFFPAPGGERQQPTVVLRRRTRSTSNPVLQPGHGHTAL